MKAFTMPFYSLYRLLAIAACIFPFAAGADYVEIDLRTTVDSQLVIMHDASVDRMTAGKGLSRPA
jgi:glycerophosphoryl diester phosphodiesterase